MMVMPMAVVVRVRMASPGVMLPPVVVVVVLAVPMSLVQDPTFAIVVVVRMRPVSPLIRRPLPASPHPPVAVAYRLPISLYPNESRVGRRPRLLINHRRWRRPDVHRNLR